MTDQTDPNTLLAALQAQLAGMQQPFQTPATMALPGQLQPTGVQVPIRLSTPAGECRCYLTLPASVAANPMVLMTTLQGLMTQGWPIDLWQPRQQQNNGWNNGNGGGWHRNGRSGGRYQGGRW